MRAFSILWCLRIRIQQVRAVPERDPDQLVISDAGTKHIDCDAAC